MVSEQSVTFSASDGVILEARLGQGRAATGGLVICHPHPQYGGDMENPVVVRVAEVARDSGLATLRFNFRGVGRSGGTYGGGRDERRDVEGALAELKRVIGPSAILVLAGYSFGATVAAAVAARWETLGGLALIAPPLGLEGLERLPPLEAFGKPLLVVAGDADPYCPAAALAELGETLPHAMIRTIEGADHFFFGKLFPLGQVVSEWLTRL